MDRQNMQISAIVEININGIRNLWMGIGYIHERFDVVQIDRLLMLVVGLPVPEPIYHIFMLICRCK